MVILCPSKDEIMLILTIVLNQRKFINFCFLPGLTVWFVFLFKFQIREMPVGITVLLCSSKLFLIKHF